MFSSPTRAKERCDCELCSVGMWPPNASPELLLAGSLVALEVEVEVVLAAASVSIFSGNMRVRPNESVIFRGNVPTEHQVEGE